MFFFNVSVSQKVMTTQVDYSTWFPQESNVSPGAGYKVEKYSDRYRPRT